MSQVIGKKVCFLPANYPLLPNGTGTGTKKETQSDHLWSRGTAEGYKRASLQGWFLTSNNL